MYIFLKTNSVNPYYVLNINLGNLRKQFESFIHPDFQFGISCTYLKKYINFSYKKSTFFKGQLGPIKPYYVLNIYLGNSGSNLRSSPTPNSNLKIPWTS